MTATVADRILDLLDSGRVLDDDEIAAKLGVDRHHVNHICRRLVASGLLSRERGARAKIVNRRTPAARPATRTVPTPPTRGASSHVSEDEVKHAVKCHLEAEDFRVTVMWGRERGIDIDARHPDGRRYVIEAKGEVALQPQQVNYFLGALGELVQRMSDGDAMYGLALPDNLQYRGLVERLPRVARERLHLVVFFVRREVASLSVDEA